MSGSSRKEQRRRSQNRDKQDSPPRKQDGQDRNQRPPMFPRWIYLGILALGLYLAGSQYMRQRNIRSHLDGLEQARTALKSTTSDRAQAYKNQVKLHRTALVNLGYLEELVFPMKNMTPDSPGFGAFVNDMRTRFENSPGVSLDLDDITGQLSIRTFEHRFGMEGWQRFVDAYDNQPNNEWIPERPVATEMNAFVGEWIDQDGLGTYIIKTNTQGGLSVKALAQTGWTTEIKNLRAWDVGESKPPTLAMDQFYWKLPTEDAEAQADPLERLWCEVELRPDDSTAGNTLVKRMKHVNLDKWEKSNLQRVNN
ncbi:MAG: hypothetical protein ACPGXK_13805 [Phycisphaerae bacterium]